MAELGWSLRVRDVVNVREGGVTSCCAAGRGAAAPRSAVRLTAAASPRTTAAAASVSASVASPRTNFFTLK